jgi:hypothetical protein
VPFPPTTTARHSSTRRGPTSDPQEVDSGCAQAIVGTLLDVQLDRKRAVHGSGSVEVVARPDGTCDPSRFLGGARTTGPTTWPAPLPHGLRWRGKRLLSEMRRRISR